MIVPIIYPPGELDDIEVDSLAPYLSSPEGKFKRYDLALSHTGRLNRTRVAYVSIYAPEEWTKYEVDQTVKKYETYIFTYCQIAEQRGYKK